MMIKQIIASNIGIIFYKHLKKKKSAEIVNIIRYINSNTGLGGKSCGYVGYSVHGVRVSNR